MKKEDLDDPRTGPDDPRSGREDLRRSREDLRRSREDLRRGREDLRRDREDLRRDREDLRHGREDPRGSPECRLRLLARRPQPPVRNRHLGPPPPASAVGAILAVRAPSLQEPASCRRIVRWVPGRDAGDSGLEARAPHVGVSQMRTASYSFLSLFLHIRQRERRRVQRRCLAKSRGIRSRAHPQVSRDARKELGSGTIPFQRSFRLFTPLRRG